jgi:5-methylcytosine-specific restriction endonuclease McrA
MSNWKLVHLLEGTRPMGLVSNIYGRPSHQQQIRNAKRSAAKAARKAAKEKAKRFAEKSPPYHLGMGSEFYDTQEWRKLRWSVLSSSNGKCCMCGHTAKTSGRPMHIDHIHPRSRYPALELSRSNLQVLCEACNMGKGATS